MQAGNSIYLADSKKDSASNYDHQSVQLARREEMYITSELQSSKFSRSNACKREE
jgi:hypothetical protein